MQEYRNTGVMVGSFWDFGFGARMEWHGMVQKIIQCRVKPKQMQHGTNQGATDHASS